MARGSIGKSKKSRWRDKGGNVALSIHVGSVIRLIKLSGFIKKRMFNMRRV